MATSTKGYGSSVSVSDTSGGTFVPISQCRDITPPKWTVDSDDTKHMSSTGQFKEKAPGWIDSDAVSFDMLFTKAQFNTLVGYIGLTKWWKVVDADGNYEKFEGHITSIGREIPMEGRVAASVEITPSALPSFTAV